MFLIVGLGNPDIKYKKSRHNIGFEIIDKFAKENNFSDFKFSKKINGELSEGSFDEEKVILLKPQTFMNLSGKSIKAFLKNREVELNKLFVVHDDIDLPLGKIRIVKNRGTAGHKGVESIAKKLKTKGFVRFRIGIQPFSGKPGTPAKFVLQKFTNKEEKTYKETVKKTVEAIKTAIEQSLEKTMTEYN